MHKRSKPRSTGMATGNREWRSKTSFGNLKRRPTNQLSARGISRNLIGQFGSNAFYATDLREKDVPGYVRHVLKAQGKSIVKEG